MWSISTNGASAAPSITVSVLFLGFYTDYPTGFGEAGLLIQGAQCVQNSI